VVEHVEALLGHLVGAVVERQGDSLANRGAAAQYPRERIEHRILDQSANRRSHCLLHTVKRRIPQGVHSERWRSHTVRRLTYSFATKCSKVGGGYVDAVSKGRDAVTARSGICRCPRICSTGPAPMAAYSSIAEAMGPPRFGGGSLWNALTYVRQQFSPFIEIVERGPPASSSRRDRRCASALGLNGATTKIGPCDGAVIRDTVVPCSRVGTARGVKPVRGDGARSACLSADREYHCGDVMSYFLDRVACASSLSRGSLAGRAARRQRGGDTQNSYAASLWSVCAGGTRSIRSRAAAGPAPTCGSRVNR
jgi:hypothetical protein